MCAIFSLTASAGLLALGAAPVIELKRHVGLIGKQLRFLARHALAGTNSDNETSTAALREIVKILQRTTYVIAREIKWREAAARVRLERNKVATGNREERRS